MGSMGGGETGGGSGTQKVINEPWSAAVPHLTYGMGMGRSLLNQGGPSYFTGQNYYNQSPETSQAISGMFGRSQAGSPVMDAAGGLTQRTLQGDFLTPDSNPYLRSYHDQAVNAALPSVNATFSGAGRTGAAAQTQAIGDTMGAIGRDIYGGAYDQERQRQMQSLLFAPQIAANDYADIQAGLTAGQLKDQNSQRILDANMERHNFNQNRPWDALNRYMQIVGQGGQGGGTQTSQQPQYGGNPLTGALGGAMTAGALGGLPGMGFLGGPWGMAGGALLGAFM